jgi:hypothetical protein
LDKNPTTRRNLRHFYSIWLDVTPWRTRCWPRQIIFRSHGVGLDLANAIRETYQDAQPVGVSTVAGRGEGDSHKGPTANGLFEFFVKGV